MTTLSCSRLLRRPGAMKMITTAAVSCMQHVVRNFVGCFRPTYLAEPSTQALEQPYTSNATDFGARPNWHRFASSHARNVAVAVHAPWRVICSARGMRGTYAALQNSGRIAGTLNARGGEIAQGKVAVFLSQGRASQCRSCPQPCYGIAPTYQGHPQQNPRPAGPKKQSRPTPLKET